MDIIIVVSIKYRGNMNKTLFLFLISSDLSPFVHKHQETKRQKSIGKFGKTVQKLVFTIIKDRPLSLNKIANMMKRKLNGFELNYFLLELYLYYCDFWDLCAFV